MNSFDFEAKYKGRNVEDHAGGYSGRNWPIPSRATAKKCSRYLIAGEWFAWISFIMKKPKNLISLQINTVPGQSGSQHCSSAELQMPWVGA